MTIKRFSIIASIIIGIVLITSIVLSCVKIDNGLNIAQPDKIIIYKESSTGVEFSQEQRPGDFNKLNNLYKNSTRLSIMDHLLNGRNIKELPSQDLDEEYGNWLVSNKENNYCVELIFDEKQSTVVEIEGNTKVVEFYGLIMIVEKSTLGHEVAMYFSNSTSSSKSYTKAPILISAKQNGLYKFIENFEIEE